MSTNLHPTMAACLAPFAPPQSVVHTVAEEAAAIKADLAYNELKNSGELRRREDHRAFLLQLQNDPQR